MAPIGVILQPHSVHWPSPTHLHSYAARRIFPWVFHCHACCMCDRLSVADLISLKALDTNSEIPLYAVFSSDFSFETSAYGVSFLFVAVPFPLTSPSSANIDSFEICLNRVIAGSGTPSNSEQANIPALSQTQI